MARSEDSSRTLSTCGFTMAGRSDTVVFTDQRTGERHMMFYMEGESDVRLLHEMYREEEPEVRTIVLLETVESVAAAEQYMSSTLRAFGYTDLPR